MPHLLLYPLSPLAPPTADTRATFRKEGACGIWLLKKMLITSDPSNTQLGEQGSLALTETPPPPKDKKYFLWLQKGCMGQRPEEVQH